MSQLPPQSPIPAQIVVDPRGAMPLPPRRSRFWPRLLLLLLILVLGGSILLNLVLLSVTSLAASDGDGRVLEKYYSHASTGSAKVAIIPVDGLIAETDGFLKRAIDRATDDKAVRAVVLRVDSPGGTVSASDFLYHRLRRLATKRPDVPLVVSMGQIAASGGYYMAMAVGDKPDTIFAEPTTWTGSIGVIIPHYNLSGLMDTINVKDDSIASHPLKMLGSFTRPMGKEDREILQKLVDEEFGRFKDIVKSGRPQLAKHPGELEKLATGQIFSAQQALAGGLVDKIGFLDDAIDRAIQLAKLDKDDVRVVKYRREVSFSSLLFGGESQARLSGPALSASAIPAELAALSDAARPQAYYLCTWLAPLTTATRRDPR